jgi:hypothetical protein
MGRWVRLRESSLWNRSSVALDEGFFVEEVDLVALGAASVYSVVYRACPY